MCEGVTQRTNVVGGKPLTEEEKLRIAGYVAVEGAPEPLPLAPPPFTLKEIRESIPPHCFERSLIKSFGHLFQDFVLVAAMLYAATFIDHPAVPVSLRYVLWPVYWILQGTFLTGVWVMAHECGHQAFSDYKIVNDTVGMICHSMLLVPYHNWRITHRRHHSNTGSCDNDEVFVPNTRSMVQEMISESPLVNLYQIVVMLTFGWMPGYLVFNATGPSKYHGQNANHFSPSAVFYTPKERLGVVVSNIGFFIWFAVLIWFSMTYSFTTLFFYYIVPYMVVNHNLVLITFLQHTDTFIPHFRGEEWNWFRGALCTVDRKFGAFFDWAFHNITDTHVCHHIFSTMPFYNATEATLHMKKKLGKYYLYDETAIPLALWRAYTQCKYVEDNGDIVFYKKKI